MSLFNSILPPAPARRRLAAIGPINMNPNSAEPLSSDDINIKMFDFLKKEGKAEKKAEEKDKWDCETEPLICKAFKDFVDKEDKEDNDNDNCKIATSIKYLTLDGCDKCIKVIVYKNADEDRCKKEYTITPNSVSDKIAEDTRKKYRREIFMQILAYKLLKNHDDFKQFKYTIKIPEIYNWKEKIDETTIKISFVMELIEEHPNAVLDNTLNKTVEKFDTALHNKGVWHNDIFDANKRVLSRNIYYTKCKSEEDKSEDACIAVIDFGEALPYGKPIDSHLWEVKVSSGPIKKKKKYNKATRKSKNKATRKSKNKATRKSNKKTTRKSKKLQRKKHHRKQK